MDPPNRLVADRRYEVSCESTGSRPNAIITWYKGKRQLRRTKVSISFFISFFFLLSFFSYNKKVSHIFCFVHLICARVRECLYSFAKTSIFMSLNILCKGVSKQENLKFYVWANFCEAITSFVINFTKHIQKNLVLTLGPYVRLSFLMVFYNYVHYNNSFTRFLHMCRNNQSNIRKKTERWWWRCYRTLAWW